MNEFLLLIIEVLTDTLGHGDSRAFQFQHTQRNPIDVEHHIRAFAMRLGIGSRNSHFLGNGEVVLLMVLPINQPHSLRVFADLGLHLHAVAQQVINGTVPVVETLAAVARCLLQFVQRLADQAVGMSLSFQPIAQQFRLDVAVAFAFEPFALCPTAKVLVTQLIAKQLHHALLSALLDLADRVHTSASLSAA